MSKYYVSNPSPVTVIIGEVSIGPYKADVVDITADEAKDLKAKGWNPRLKDQDTEQDTEPKSLDEALKAAAIGVVTSTQIMFVADNEEIAVVLPSGYVPLVVVDMVTAPVTAAGIQTTLNIPAGNFHGQRLLINYGTEADADDTVTLESADGFYVGADEYDAPVFTAAATFVALEWNGSAGNWQLDGYSAVGVTTAQSV